MADDTIATSATPLDKKSKSHKKHKRHREADGTEGSERKHKKSKSSSNAIIIEPEAPIQIEAKLQVAPIPEAETETNHNGGKAEKKKKRKHKDQPAENGDENHTQKNDATDVNASANEKKKSKEHKKKKKHDKVEANGATSQDTVIPDSQPASKTPHDPDAMDIDSAPVDASSSEEFGQKPSEKEYPFFTQTVSQYLPLFPSGLIEPIEGFADQHLRPLLNRYVPSFRGILLDYRNPRVGEAPGKGALTEESATDDIVLLESINEYAVTFGWLTVDVDVFRPSRGAWMEGTVNLQGEGHIGVICWNMFNASIEAKRLPQGWRWVDLLSKDNDKFKSKGKKNDREKTAEEAKLPTPDPFDEAENDTTQIHTTGYWVDGSGTRIRGGAKLYFRIKHYEVGVSGDYGYLSIEGTMLNEEEEKAKYAEEMEALRRRRLRHGGTLRKEQKRLPEFSMTKFGVNEAEDNEAQRAPIQIASRPGSDTE
ncbi:uncharacterized protein F4822DRAFT_388166 [Hypoxylon trugodes]|uniref:uncharacterized protein n=1 Tax=Hypoxylon trugodes TaxID=326681 RepID=UPI0021927182|nr:uncharacterized protein F4822DRAFT_388166 [Hypoxylon trugodes]KAI1394434.1 hypothetical protein F4822DRAFT_388166 [Hypoxylon trugodes]